VPCFVLDGLSCCRGPHNWQVISNLVLSLIPLAGLAAGKDGRVVESRVSDEMNFVSEEAPFLMPLQ
jgi:hypothetical protein